MNIHEFSGIVQDGKGDASFWIHTFANAYSLWLGKMIFPGSLNLKLPHIFDWNAKSVVHVRQEFSLRPHGGERNIYFIPITIINPGHEKCWLWSTTTAAMNRPDPDVVEIISENKLRDKYKLSNGSKIEFKISS